MAISDTKLSDWTIVSGDNSPGDSKRVGRDLSDELRNINDPVLSVTPPRVGYFGETYRLSRVL